MVNFSVGAEKIQNDNTIFIWHYQKVRMFERKGGKNERRKSDNHLHKGGNALAKMCKQRPDMGEIML